MSARTRERILDGAATAVARHGLAKLEMSDVSAIAGVSRGTLYRYFPSRDVLLDELARHEARLFKQRMLAAIEQAPPGAERIRVALEHATRHVREHAGLQRMLETDPAFVLEGLRAQFASLKDELGALLGPLLHESELVRARIVGADQLLDWLLRLMVSAFLLPEQRPDEMTRGLTAVYRILTARLDAAPQTAAVRRGPRVRRPDEAGAGRRRARAARAAEPTEP
jgi:AcrR family transcriptional regulator